MDVDFVFCKQKTAYEMRISDWSSDVCSSDLNALPLPLAPMRGAMNVLTGDFILAADGLHGLANSAPSITAIAPAAWLVPQDTLHSIAGQERKSGRGGKEWSVRVDLGGRRNIKKKTSKNNEKQSTATPT